MTTTSGKRVSLLDSQDGGARFAPSAFMPERINQEISKRYDINTREIGSGGYGKVFVAKDRQMANRMVAIKKVIILDQEKKKAFQKEAGIMKTLDHPNICKLLETYEQGRFMFFVMEYCEGREVFDRIMEQNKISESTTADILRQSASALKYAHAKGIAHRDMKPENICFCTNNPEDNTVKVIDWGLGFYFGEARMSSAVGSLTYAAPEVLEARDVSGYSCACDQWSMGVVCYVMLCGKPPFWGNYQEQLKRMKKEQYPMSDTTWNGISANAKAIIKGLLKNNPKDRMSLDVVLSHPWLKGATQQTDSKICQEVLLNMKQFSRTSQFFSLCVASVARQLDHKSLRDVHKVFSELDTNGDGVLELQEVKAGFEKMFGKNSEQVKDVEAMFSRLDLDGSGKIDYTEFCAAGIGERMSTEEDVLWAAFKTFDVNDDDGKVTRDEIQKVLRKAGVTEFWSDQVCQELSAELFERFDKNGDGSIDFDEWVRLMREIASRHRQPGEGAEGSPADDDQRQLLAELDRTQNSGGGGFDKAYNLLVDLDRKQEGGTRTTGKSGQSSRGSPTAGRTQSGLVKTSDFLRSNTPACFSCGSRDGKGCQIM